ncbi:protein SPEAR1-like [Rutidosis leptorrhynchoides]|uniref:protein SPEAR1-like n=1 Tax=Rutidosis leptorrhynchoides TaxID=125765 RepID=UPI003A9914EA
MNYYGGNERSSSSSSANGSSSSSRKGKKNGSDKQPRQPQRGLGVAQLEKIRLHSQMGFLPQEDIRIQTAYSSSSSSFSYTSPSTTLAAGHHSHMFLLAESLHMQMGMGELETHGESLVSSIHPRWDASSGMLEAQGYAQPAGVSRYQFNPELLEVKDSLKKKKRKDQNDSMGSSSQNSDSNGSQELDLELRLSF